MQKYRENFVRCCLSKEIQLNYCLFPSFDFNKTATIIRDCVY